MSDTPETDAKIKIELTCACYPNEYVSGDFARNLERERDDLQKAVNGLCDHFGVSPANTTLLAVEVLKIERERDEAREDLESEKNTRNAIIEKGLKLERQLREAKEALEYIANAGLSARHIEDYAKEFLSKK